MESMALGEEISDEEAQSTSIAVAVQDNCGSLPMRAFDGVVQLLCEGALSGARHTRQNIDRFLFSAGLRMIGARLSIFADVLFFAGGTASVCRPTIIIWSPNKEKNGTARRPSLPKKV